MSCRSHNPGPLVCLHSLTHTHPHPPAWGSVVTWTSVGLLEVQDVTSVSVLVRWRKRSVSVGCVSLMNMEYTRWRAFSKTSIGVKHSQTKEQQSHSRKTFHNNRGAKISFWNTQRLSAVHLSVTADLHSICETGRSAPWCVPPTV